MSLSRAWPMLVMAALLSLPAFAQEERRPEGGPGGGPGGRGGDRRPPNPLMQALDTDGDGELSAKEIENATASLKAIDKNKDGKLAGEEIRPAFTGFGGGQGGPGGGRGQFDPEQMLDRAFANDKNKDGKLTLDEIPEEQRRFMENLLKESDADKDGAVTRDELKKGMDAMRERFRNGGGRPGGQGAPGGAPRGQRPSPEA